MRQWIYAASASLVLLGTAGQANALPINPMGPAAIPSDIEQAQFIFGDEIIAGTIMAGAGQASIGAVTRFAAALVGAAARGGMAGTAAEDFTAEVGHMVGCGRMVDTVAADRVVDSTVVVGRVAADTVDTRLA
jgi:hypothetical protein